MDFWNLRLILAFFCMSTAKVNYPLLNDVTAKDITDQSVIVEWLPLSHQQNRSMDSFRLFVEIQVQDGGPLYSMNPPSDDPSCSLVLSYCYLKYLFPATNYKVTVKIDRSMIKENETNNLLGYAKMEFRTKEIYCNEWWLFYVVLPLSGGILLQFIIILGLTVYCCRRSRRKLPPKPLPPPMPALETESINYEMPEKKEIDTNDVLVAIRPPPPTDDTRSQHSYVSMISSNNNNQSAASLTPSSIDQSQSSNLPDYERMRNGNSTAIYSNPNTTGRNNQRHPQQDTSGATANANQMQPIYENQRFISPPKPKIRR